MLSRDKTFTLDWSNHDLIPSFIHNTIIQKAELHMALQGEIKPLPTDVDSIWNGIDTRVIENVNLNLCKSKEKFSLKL